MNLLCFANFFCAKNRSLCGCKMCVKLYGFFLRENETFVRYNIISFIIQVISTRYSLGCNRIIKCFQISEVLHIKEHFTTHSFHFIMRGFAGHYEKYTDLLLIPSERAKKRTIS